MTSIHDINNIIKVLHSVDKKALDIQDILNKLNTNKDNLILLKYFLSNKLSLINQYSNQLKLMLKKHLKNAEKQESLANVIYYSLENKSLVNMKTVKSSRIISELTYIDTHGTLSNHL